MFINKYRAVYVSYILSNIFEKIMYNRVTAFLETSTILHDDQIWI